MVDILGVTIYLTSKSLINLPGLCKSCNKIITIVNTVIFSSAESHSSWNNYTDNTSFHPEITSAMLQAEVGAHSATMTNLKEIGQRDVSV